jgi:hypothetical protein
MAKAHGPTMEVETVIWNAHFLGHRAGGGSKGFVVLIDIDIENIEVVAF